MSQAKPEYDLNLKFSEEDQAYVLTCKQFPGFSVLYKDPDDCLRLGANVFRTFIEYNKENKENI